MVDQEQGFKLPMKKLKKNISLIGLFALFVFSLPTVFEAAPSSVRFARSGDFWGWEDFLQNPGLDFCSKSGAGSVFCYCRKKY